MKKIIALILTLCLLLPVLALAEITEQEFFSDFTIIVPEGSKCEIQDYGASQTFTCYLPSNDNLVISKLPSALYDLTKVDPAEVAQEKLDSRVEYCEFFGEMITDQRILQAGWIDLQGTQTMKYTYTFNIIDYVWNDNTYFYGEYHFSLAGGNYYVITFSAFSQEALQQLENIIQSTLVWKVAAQH